MGFGRRTGKRNTPRRHTTTTTPTTIVTTITIVTTTTATSVDIPLFLIPEHSSWFEERLVRLEISGVHATTTAAKPDAKAVSDGKATSTADKATVVPPAAASTATGGGEAKGGSETESEVGGMIWQLGRDPKKLNQLIWMFRLFCLEVNDATAVMTLSTGLQQAASCGKLSVKVKHAVYPAEVVHLRVAMYDCCAKMGGDGLVEKLKLKGIDVPSATASELVTVTVPEVQIEVIGAVKAGVLAECSVGLPKPISVRAGLHAATLADCLMSPPKRKLALAPSDGGDGGEAKVGELPEGEASDVASASASASTSASAKPTPKKRPKLKFQDDVPRKLAVEMAGFELDLFDETQIKIVPPDPTPAGESNRRRRR